MNEKFTTTRGETGGSLQLIFYYVSKVTVAELNAKIAEVFPGIPPEKLNVFPGYINCVITTGSDLEIPKN